MNHTGTIAMLRPHTLGPLLCLLALAPAGASPALAQEAADPFARCAAISADGERLACFDATYASRDEARAARERQAEVAREAEYGLSAPQREERRERQAVSEQAATQPAPIDEEARAAGETGISAKVVAVSHDGAGRALVRLDNGQLWRERDGTRLLGKRLRDGWTATITPHWSGAYRMRFAERSGYLMVSRVR